MFDPTALADAKAHALESFPHEAVGVILPAGYVRLNNVHPDPLNNFSITDADYLTYGPDALALVHSHPVENAFDTSTYAKGFYPHCPTHTDMVGQMAWAKPWGIVVTDGETAAEPFFWGDFLLDQPLTGHEFRHGVNDCYTAVRRWFWQNRGIKLKEIPRDDEWFFQEGAENALYMNNLRACGFEKIDSDEIEPGDCGLVSVGDRRLKQVNHAFVYVGNGLAYHHLPKRLPQHEPVGARARQVHTWVRYTGPGATVASESDDAS